MMASSYYQNLIKRVLEASTTDNWEIAVREWDIVDCEEDEEHASEEKSCKGNRFYSVHRNFVVLPISTTKFLVAETSSGDYNFHRWTCKPTEIYSVNSKQTCKPPELHTIMII